MNLLKFFLPFFFALGLVSHVFAQDFTFTKSIAKTTGETHYNVEVNEQRVLSSLQKGSTLEFNLNGKSFSQSVKRVNQLSFGYTGVTAHPIQGSSYSNLMVKNGELTGVLHFDGKPYRLSNQDGEYQFFQITEEVHQCSLDDFLADNNSFQKSITDAGGENSNPVYNIDDYSDTTTVDVLVLYTSKAKEWASGSNNSVTNDIDEIFALNEGFKNDIIENSKLALNIRFVGYVEIDNPTATSTSDKLSNMRDNTYAGSTHTSDTVDIHSLRSQFGADLVALVDSIEDTGGLGYRINGIGGGKNSGFSVSRVQQMSFNYVLMHEIGHNFGNAHGRTQTSNAATDKGGIFQFSTGHSFQGSSTNEYVSVMHYEGLSSGGDAETVPYFSNPRVTFQDSATGSYSGPSGPSDNVLSMSITKNWLADYQNTVIDPAEITLTTTAIEDTVYPSGVSTRNIIIENTGDSDLEVKIDGKMAFSSSLKTVKTIKQPLNLSYGFEQSEGFETGSYTAYNNWIAADDEDFEISTTYAFSGTQSIKASTATKPYIQSPYFSTTSRYSSYTISFKVYSDGGPARTFLEFSSADTKNEAAGVLLLESGEVAFYGMNGSKSYWNFSDSQVSDQWVDVSITISTANGGTISYEYGDAVSRTFTGNGFYFPEAFYLVQSSSSGYDVYVDDIQIKAEDLYGPALAISDSRMTIRPGQTDTMTVTFYGNGYEEGVYDGNIYLETNVPTADSTITIPVDLYIDPNNQHPNENFAVEITGQEGFRLLSAPTNINLMEFLEPLHTQGATNADVTNGSPVVWTWDKSFTGTTNLGWTPVADLDTTVSSGDAFLIYVFDESVYGDSTSRGFPKLLPISGTTVSSATPSVNQHADGLTLVGNPYPSTIDWDEVSTTELENAIYIYDPNASSWESYVDGAGDITGGLIKPFQGFFVQSSSSVSSGPAISFSSDDISSGDEFYGKSAEKSSARFEIEDPESNLSNSAWVVFNNQATEGKDSFDALEFPPLSTKYIYTSTTAEDGTALDINALPDFEQSLEVPLNIQSNIAESVRFTLTDIAGLENIDISLSNGNWTKEISLNEAVTFDYSPKDLLLENGFPASVQKKNASGYKLVFSKKSTVSTEEPNIPQEFTLLQNYPNPFNPTTSIRFGLPSAATVKLSVYNVLGQLVDVVVNETLQAGFHTLDFNAENLSSGVYLFRIEAGAFVDSKKMVLMK